MKTKHITSLLLGSCLLYLPNVYSACSGYNNDILDFSNVQAPSKTTILCGQEVTISTQSKNGESGTVNLADISGSNNGALSAPISIAVNGETVISGNKITQADMDKFLKVLDQQSNKRYFSASSLASTSASSKVGDVIQNQIISPMLPTKNQANQQKQARFNSGQNMNVFLTDLRYERGEFRQTDDTGNIGGFTAGASYDFTSSISVGALVPYDYMDFKSFEAHRTGIILYGKKIWDLSNHFELTTSLNTNYIYTTSDFKSGSSFQTSTAGGGFSSRLVRDDGGDFIPAASFSVQYNHDDTNYVGNYQYWAKMGPSLGYRVTDNSVIQVSGIYNRDVTGRSFNADIDYFDTGIEGSWIISDTWQLRGGFKKILGYTEYDSDTFYLGSSSKF